MTKQDIEYFSNYIKHLNEQGHEKEASFCATMILNWARDNNIGFRHNDEWDFLVRSGIVD